MGFSLWHWGTLAEEGSVPHLTALQDELPAFGAVEVQEVQLLLRLFNRAVPCVQLLLDGLDFLRDEGACLSGVDHIRCA